MDCKQLSFDMDQFLYESKDWKELVKDLCNSIVSENNLPEGSLYLAENKGKKEGKKEMTASYSVCIYEPEYPLEKNHGKEASRNTVVMNIKEDEKKTKTTIRILVRESTVDFVGLLDGAEDKGTQKGTYFHLFQFDATSIDEMIDAWMKYLKDVINYELRNYESKATPFGCCSHFVECSDAGECVHKNKLYACACYYKENLESGNVFYGKNKNI